MKVNKIKMSSAAVLLGSLRLKARNLTAYRITKDVLQYMYYFVAVALLFYVHGKHLRSCRDGQLT